MNDFDFDPDQPEQEAPAAAPKPEPQPEPSSEFPDSLPLLPLLVHGMVTCGDPKDPTPVQGAFVTLDPGADDAQEGVTGPSGFFGFPNQAAGEHVVQVVHHGVKRQAVAQVAQGQAGKPMAFHF